jgi:hypothetical protein
MGFKVVIAAVNLHFNVGLLAVVKSDMNVQETEGLTEYFSQEKGREYFGVLETEIHNRTVDAT